MRARPRMQSLPLGAAPAIAGFGNFGLGFLGAGFVGDFLASRPGWSLLCRMALLPGGQLCTLPTYIHTLHTLHTVDR
jgi:hypothetical protein